jgi:hypothetical protein
MAFPAAGTAGGSAAEMVTVPATAARTTSEPATSALAPRHVTRVRFLRFGHVRPWGRTVHIRGQVAAKVNGRWGALKRVHVTVYRQLDGKTRWQALQTRSAGNARFPRFVFHVRAKANADYRVVFNGNARFRPSRATTAVSVHRRFNARLRDGSGAFHGRVRPNYHNKVIHLEKRRCAQCRWDEVRAKRTGERGGWRFDVGAPRSGRWWWRVTVPGSTAYIRSSSAVFTTKLT